MTHDTLSSPATPDTDDWGTQPWESPDTAIATSEALETPKRRGLMKRVGDKVTGMLGSGPESSTESSFYTPEERAGLDKIAAAEREFAAAEAAARQANPNGFAELDAIDAEINSETEMRERLARVGDYSTNVGPSQQAQEYRADKYNFIKSGMEDHTPYGARWKEARAAVNTAKDEFRAGPAAEAPAETTESSDW